MKLEPFCRIAGHTSEEVREILVTLETVYRGLFIPIDLKRFTASSVTSVECPHCARTRSLSPIKGVLRFPPHMLRKIQTARSWQALVYNRQNGLGRGWRRNHERQELILPLRVIACIRLHHETFESLLS